MNPIKKLERELLAAIENNPGDLANVAAILLDTYQEESGPVLFFMLRSIAEGEV